MTQTKKKQSTKPKGQATTLEELKKPATSPASTLTKPKAAPKAKEEVITKLGVYQLKTHFGGLSAKAVPIPGKRVILIGGGFSQTISDIELIYSDGVYSLK